MKNLPVLGRAFNILGGGKEMRKTAILPMQYPFVVYRRDEMGMTGESCKREEGDGDLGFWLMFQRANDAYGPALVGWPAEPVIDCLTDSFPERLEDGTTEWDTPDGFTKQKLQEDTASNEAALLDYGKLSDFPRGDRIAVVGRSPSSAGFAAGEPLGLNGAQHWEPNLSLYLNWTPDRPVRALATRTSQRWLVVMDRRVKANVLDGDGAPNTSEFMRWDGLFVSLGADPGLIAAAMLRRIPIVALDYREGIAGFYRKGFCRVRHLLGCGPMTLLMVGMGATKGLGVHKTGSLLIAGLDGNQRGCTVPPPPAPGATEEDVRKVRMARGFAIDQIGQYYDLGTASAAVAFYLDQLGIKVHHLCGNGTPYHVATMGLTQTQLDAVPAVREVAEKEEAK